MKITKLTNIINILRTLQITIIIINYRHTRNNGIKINNNSK